MSFIVTGFLFMVGNVTPDPRADQVLFCAFSTNLRKKYSVSVMITVMPQRKYTIPDLLAPSSAVDQAK
jgi:hypothetical protein